jgi:hypothetical protein
MEAAMKQIFLFISILNLFFLPACHNGKAPTGINPTADVTELLVTPTPVLLSETQPPAAEMIHAPERNQYIMELTLDTDSKRIDGVIRVILKNDSGDVWDRLCFRDYAASVFNLFQRDIQNQQIAFFTDIREEYSAKTLRSDITDITDIQTGKRLHSEPEPSDPSIIFVELETPLQPDGFMEIEMHYAADIPPGWYRYDYRQFKNGTIEFNLGNFYPILAVYENGEWITHPYVEFGEPFYSKCADYSVTLLVPEGYTVVASGEEKWEQTDNGIARWVVRAENMRDFALTASNNLSKLSADIDGITVNSYYVAEGDQEGADHKLLGESMLHAGVESIRLFSSLYGYYPYEELDIVETILGSAGMEYPSLIRISDTIALRMERYSEDEFALSTESLVAHETAHQWFYAVIGNDQFLYSWIDESFASFSALLFKRNYMSSEKFEEELDWAIPLEEPINLPLDQYKSYPVYAHGSRFLYKLCMAMGEPKFFNMMREYYAAFMFKEAATEDFLFYVYQYAPNTEAIDGLINEYINIKVKKNSRRVINRLKFFLRE